MAQAINTQHWPLAQVSAEVGLASWLLVAALWSQGPTLKWASAQKEEGLSAGWEVERGSPEALEKD